MEQGEIILYQPNDSLRLEVRLDGDNVWLNRSQLAELFDRDVKTIGKHINNALKEELDNVPVVAKFATTAADGKVYQTEHYNLDMVISVGFRVKSRRGVDFRRWANTILKEYMLKGYAMEKNGIAEKYRASSYKSLKRKISALLEILDNAYGKAYCQICNPILDGNVVNFGINEADKEKSRRIIHSFGTKLKILMLGEETEITFHDEEKTKQKYRFTDEERLSFVLFGILYASRCNNFHGNVAARMNSINANIDTFKMYTDIFLMEYIILATHMNSQNVFSDSALDKVKKNVNLMI